jgi:isoleucyl-tRNA synthetase
MLAPMLAFTAEEAWEFIPGKPTPSVHLSEWEAKAFAPEGVDEWGQMLRLRDEFLKGMEQMRQQKQIGKSLEAKIEIGGRTDEVKLVHRNVSQFQELLNVSQLTVDLAADLPEKHLSVGKADGQKCERCWHWETEVGANTEHPTLCPRCVEAVKLG